MILRKITDAFGRIINLTDERWKHITVRHPELQNKKSLLEQTLKQPDAVIENALDSDIHLVHRWYTSKNWYCVVVIHTRKKFIITAYVSNKLKKGNIIWQKI